jgi:hypothetical protein
MPSWQVGHPAAERQSYSAHDPFPDADAGPDTQTRPRGFTQQRAEPRRTLEGQMYLGIPPGGDGAAAPMLPSANLANPNLVEP